MNFPTGCSKCFCVAYNHAVNTKQQTYLITFQKRRAEMLERLSEMENLTNISPTLFIKTAASFPDFDWERFRYRGMSADVRVFVDPDLLEMKWKNLLDEWKRYRD